MLLSVEPISSWRSRETRKRKRSTSSRLYNLYLYIAYITAAEINNNSTINHHDFQNENLIEKKIFSLLSNQFISSILAATLKINSPAGREVNKTLVLPPIFFHSSLYPSNLYRY